MVINKLKEKNAGNLVILGSILIAEFLGSEYIDDDSSFCPDGYYYQPPSDDEYDVPTGDPCYWKFDSSWDWIIPVIEIIEQKYKYDVHIYGHHNWKNPNRCLILDWKDTEIVSTSHKSKIKCVFNAVVEFINWWNVTNKVKN